MMMGCGRGEEVPWESAEEAQWTAQELLDEAKREGYWTSESAVRYQASIVAANANFDEGDADAEC